MPITSSMVEFHRLGRPATLLSPDTKYIRATGWEGENAEISPNLDHENFQRYLSRLRYTGDAVKASDALAALTAEARRFLPLPDHDGEGLLQVDLVTNAAELWAFPFEACFEGNAQWLEKPDRGVELTRRIRGKFSECATEWPTSPVVLFAHAPKAHDLEQDLIDRHVNALEESLRPWAKSRQLTGILVVAEVSSVSELAAAMNKAKPSYVHLLAHGAIVEDPELPDKKVWGLRLGWQGDDGVPPDAVAQTLTPENSLPLVVTIAACDGGNQANPAFGSYSLVQELHRRGIPVVIGSQLPLTKPGSVVLTRKFYERLLRAEDVRTALHAARVALHADKTAGHDWLSLVSYVRLPPEGYARYLMEFGLRAELAMMKTAQARADALLEDDELPKQATSLMEVLHDRLDTLESKRLCIDPTRKDLLDECTGLLASVNKRLAELLFRRSNTPEVGEQDRTASRAALAAAADSYRSVYRKGIQNHWHGIQQIALEAVLDGKFQDDFDWSMVLRTAEHACEEDPKEVWALGTIIEARLLEPVAGRPDNLDKAAAAIKEMKRRVGDGDDFPIESTTRQLTRYVKWWTNANGFFPGRKDLAGPAAQLLALMKA